jgi:hypothetical protein
MELNKTKFKQGEIFTIKFLLENTGDKNLTIQLYNCLYFQLDIVPMFFDFDILASNGSVVYNYSYDHVTLPMLYDYTIIPGGNLTQTYIWDQAYPNSSSRTLRSPFPSGSYSIRGLTPPRGAGGLIKTDSESWASLEIPPLVFVIR